MKVFKYRLNTELLEIGRLEIEGFAGVVHFDRDAFGDMCLWSLIYSNNDAAIVEFIVAGTGHEVDDSFDYVMTFNDGGLLRHLFLREA